MRRPVMDSLSLKIKSFLQNAGFQYDESVGTSTQLMMYFEEEYGLKVMGFLEQEWLEEQVERDIFRGQFAELREYVSRDRLADFDSAVASIWD
jgi:hypothetical protein